MGTTILVDIDGVIAQHNIPALLATYNRHLKLAIPDEQLECIKTLKAFHNAPQVQAYIATIGFERYHRQLAWLEWHPHYVAECSLVEGAWNGVRYLAQRAYDLQYCTARVIHFNAEWNADVARCTWIWLKNNEFPNENSTLFCDGIPAKLRTILEMIQSYQRPILLIDDSLDALLRAFDSLPADEKQLLRQYLTLAAFGYEDCSQDYPLNVIPFPHWREVHNLAAEKEFNYGRTQSRRQRK